MLGHYNIAEQAELHFGADFGEFVDHEIARLRRSQKWEALIATEGNEMKVALAIIAL